MADIKIMVVDDDVNICELLRLYLEKKGTIPSWLPMVWRLWRPLIRPNPT